MTGGQSRLARSTSSATIGPSLPTISATPVGIGMQAVSLHVAPPDLVPLTEIIERREVSLEQQDIAAGRQPGEDRLEIPLVVETEIRRGLVPDQQHLHPARDGPVNDGAEIPAAGFRVKPAQQIIAAKQDHHRLRPVGQGPVEPRQPAGCGVARHAGIEQGCIHLPILQPAFKLRNQPVLMWQAVALDQAVTENGDPDRLRQGAS